MTNGIGGGIIFDYLFMHFLNLVYEIGNQSAFLEVDLLNNSSQEIWILFTLTANIFESGPMPTTWKFLAGLPVIPNCLLGQN